MLGVVLVSLWSSSSALLVQSRVASPHFHIPNVVTSPRLATVSANAETVAAAPPQPFAPEDEWIAKFDAPAFKAEVQALGDKLLAEQGPADVAHLKKMVLWSNICGAIGISTLWMRPNILTIAALSTWVCTRWTMIAHHTCHGGYNKQDDGSGRFTSTGFALGSTLTRAKDWLDWMLPEAWNVEHNNLHHYRLGEPGDPDLVERNLDILREMRLPRAIKYVVVSVMAAIWKWWYYAPNTYKQLKIQDMKKTGNYVDEKDAHEAFTFFSFLNLGQAKRYGFGFRDYMRRVMGPYVLLRFILLPAPLLAISPAFYVNALKNLALADVLSNLHSFLIIATNHAGNDLYRFHNSVVPKSGSFMMRAVTSSANFRTGGDLNDFFHGWLNYQIEHHVWPNLSMLSYQKGAPQLKAICEKHGVPYVQESVFTRLKKTADIMVGATSMREFKEEWEVQEDKFKWK